MQRVALLGLGVMGAGMAANWLAKGFELSVWNRTPAKAQALAGKGARVAATPARGGGGADFIFAMVADDDASRSVWLGTDGALAGAKSGAIIVESSTLTPDWVRELARHAQAKGCGFLDAPVGGSRQAAASGELRFFVGGEPADLRGGAPRACRRSGARWICSGQSARARPGSSSTTSSPPLRSPRSPRRSRSPRKAGFEKEQISDLILGGAPASPIVKLKLPRMLAQDFEPADFALRLMLKDARYATALAQSLGAPADMISGAVKAFARAEAKGLGRQGHRRRGRLSGRSQNSPPLGGRHCLSTAMGSDDGARPGRHRGLAALLAPAPRPVLSPLARVLSIQRALEGWPSG